MPAPALSAETTSSLRRIGLLIRGSLLGLCLLLSVTGEVAVPTLVGLAVLTLLAAASVRVPPGGGWAHALRALETVVAAAAVLAGEGPTSPLLLYVLAPAFAGGISAGYAGGTSPAGVNLALFLGSGALGGRGTAELPLDIVVQWAFMPLAAGLIAAWLHGQLLRSQAEAHSRGYEEAYRLLSQLRVVARRLSVGLDPVTIAESLLQELRGRVDHRVAAVMVRTDGDSLVPIAVTGESPVAWDDDLRTEGPFSDAWLTQLPQTARRREGALGPVTHLLVLPLRTGVRSFGLVGVEHRDPVPPETVHAAQQLVDDVAVRLDTALLFDEVRGFAVAEERRRLAREIHDGVAQEVASLGYLVDNLSSSTGEAGTRDGLAELRDELTRIVSELRLSIFDLRSEVTSHGGLGAALSDYVRCVGAQSPLVVHLALDETGKRLPAETEAELLRLAQEAIQNARRHSGGRNIWVSCSIRPPRARLVVEDDGVGPGAARREGGYGMDIMRERAARLRASLTVAAREPRGTLVEVDLGHESEHAADEDRSAQPA